MLIFFGLTFFSAQNTFKVQGKIIDFHDKVPLEKATIKIGNFTQTSDSSGNFTFPSLQRGTYTLTAIHPDCASFTEQLTINKNLEITLNLEHHVKDIETVLIHGTHKNKNSLIIKTLDKKELERNSTENLGNILTSISGVGALKTGNNITKPIIHGLYGSRVAMINNGVKMAEQEWGVEHAPNVDVNQFEHLDVIKGASALRY